MRPMIDEHQRSADGSAERRSRPRKSLFPDEPVANLSKGRLVFVSALVCYATIDFWLLRWVPTGIDTGDFWHIFYASYAELLFRNDFAHWFPYGAYGQPNALYNLLELTSTDYLMMIVGKLLNVRNAVLLFELSVVADHLLFLFGVYLLSRTMFQRKSAVLLCVIASLSLLHGLQLNYIHVFRILSWYPLIVYFLARFYRERKPEALWTAGVVFIFWCLGALYLPAYMTLCLLPFMAVASWNHPQAWRSIFSLRMRNLATMAICASAALLYLYVAREMLVGIEVVRESRSTIGGVSVEAFLGARDHTLFEALISLCSGGIFYIGLLPVACVVWGLFRARSPAFSAFIWSAVLLVWFALGGLFSRWLFYYVPLFSLAGYLYMGFYLMRAPLLLAAAAAWDIFLPSQRNLKIVFLFPVIFLFLVDFSLYGEHFVVAGSNARTFFTLWRPAFVRLAVYGTFAALALIVSVIWRSTPVSLTKHRPGASSRVALLTGALLAALFVDVFQYSYQSGLPTNPFGWSYRDAPTDHWYLADETMAAYQAGRVKRLTWQPERLDAPVDARQRTILASPTYFHTYAFAQFDPCQSSLLVRSLSSSMGKLLALRDRNDVELQTILGCKAPKMRLTTTAMYVDDEKEAATAVQRTPHLAAVAILQLPRGYPRPAERLSASGENPGAVTLTEFGANALTARVHVDDPEGAWLVYADAYDPRWRAWINDKAAPIVPAYVGLKAVRVPQGDGVVRMEFGGSATVAMRILGVGGAIVSLSLLVYCAWCCIGGFPPSTRNAQLSAFPQALA